MPLSRSARAAAISIAVLSLGLGACGGDDDTTEASTEETAPTETEPQTETETEPETDTETDTETETETEDAAGSSGDTPEWAVAQEQPDGELLTTLQGEGFEVEVHQVGTATSPDDGSFVDPESNEPILKAGDPIVFVNFVITNTSDETIPLAFNLVSVDGTYVDWPWLQGMDGTTDRALYEEMGVVSSALAPGASEPPFLWEPGQTFSYGTNFEHQPGSPIVFKARLTPADDAGDLDHDKAQEVEAEATIS